MRITIRNTSDNMVYVHIDNHNPQIIQSNNTISVEVNDENITMVTRPYNESHCRTFPENYVLVLETTYRITNISDGEEFVLTRSLDDVDIWIKYDSIKLASKTASCNEDSYCVIDKEKMVRHYKKVSLLSRVIILFISECEALLCPLLIAGFVWYNNGFVDAIISFFISCIVLGIINMIIFKICCILEEKVLKLKSRDSIFFDSFENDSIMEFYERYGE